MTKVPRNAQFRCSKCSSHVARVHRHYHVWLTQLVERAPPIEQAREQTYHGLLFVADNKGYREGFAYHKYYAIYRESPKRFSKLREPPYAELLDWIDAEKRKFKAARKKEQASDAGGLGKANGQAMRSGAIPDGRAGGNGSSGSLNGHEIAIDAISSSPTSYVSELMDKDDWDVVL